jgi:hypothetical protein
MPWTEEFQRLHDAMEDAERRLHRRHTATSVAIAVVGLAVCGLMLALASLLLGAD